MTTSFEPLRWAQLALHAPTVEQAWQKVVENLSGVGHGEATFLFGQAANTKTNLSPRHCFGHFVDEEWDRRVKGNPTIAMGDPIARRFFRRERPLEMLRGNRLFRSMSLKEQAFYRYYDDHDVRAGAVWPVHDHKSGTVHVIATWTKLPPGEYLRSLRHFSSDIHLAAAFFCEALRVRELSEGPTTLQLSPRERECLLWVQAGRSTKQIADLLSLGDSTVDEYIGSGMRKLGAANRVQAAARACLLGMIDP